MDDTIVVAQPQTTQVVVVDDESAVVVSSPPQNTVVVRQEVTTVVSSFCGPSYVLEVPRLTVEYPTAYDVVSDRIVRLNNAEKVVYVNHDDLDDYDMAIGITLHDAAEGNTVRIMIMGVWEKAYFSFEAGKPIYVLTDGQLSSTPPTSGFLQSVGKAFSETVVFIDISISVVL